MDLSPISKAVAGGLVGLVIGLLSRYGFHPGPQALDALGVLTTALVSYVVGHVAVYVAPANRPKL